jgi:hypothetical protein
MSQEALLIPDPSPVAAPVQFLVPSPDLLMCHRHIYVLFKIPTPSHTSGLVLYTVVPWRPLGSSSRARNRHENPQKLEFLIQNGVVCA